MQYRTCPRCGAHLDPDERCECEDLDQPEVEMVRRSPRGKPPQEQYIDRCWKEWFER